MNLTQPSMPPSPGRPGAQHDEAFRHQRRAALDSRAEDIIRAGVKVPAGFSEWGATRTECFTMLAHHFQKRLARLRPSSMLKHPRAERTCERIIEEASAVQKIASMPLERCMQIIADGGSVEYLKGL